ncbi:MAG: class I SAM-dependent methyltransferase [Flavobacteriales bacterium]|jgi:caffeoyl-CoA O-methyltransferase|nr:class I SAM-dependent methyltransferase [Flavobacteriales bacterium]|tara:strand:+ start:2414 stop:3055 length:642 start_codon:yes stop_codon:yes gene_type:complete
MEFLPKEIEQYSQEHTQKETEVLYNLNRETHLKVLIPRMLSGHIQGRILSMFSHMLKPKNVLEIGTYTGYSAICFAEGMQPDGKLVTIDINNELETMATSYFEKSGYGNQIDMRVGNAIDIIPTLDMKFDLVFIDADKHNYSNYYDLVIDKVNQGGFIIADNVLWSGKVLTDEVNTDTDTKALDEYNKKINSDPRVENMLMPVRDGLMVARKL